MELCNVRYKYGQLEGCAVAEELNGNLLPLPYLTRFSDNVHNKGSKDSFTVNGKSTSLRVRMLLIFD